MRKGGLCAGACRCATTAHTHSKTQAHRSVSTLYLMIVTICCRKIMPQFGFAICVWVWQVPEPDTALTFEQNGRHLPAPALVSCLCCRQPPEESSEAVSHPPLPEALPCWGRRVQTRITCAMYGVPCCACGAPRQLARPQAAGLSTPLSRPTQLGAAPPLADLCWQSLRLVLRHGQSSSSRLWCLFQKCKRLARIAGLGAGPALGGG